MDEGKGWVGAGEKEERQGSGQGGGERRGLGQGEEREGRGRRSGHRKKWNELIVCDSRGEERRGNVIKERNMGRNKNK